MKQAAKRSAVNEKPSSCFLLRSTNRHRARKASKGKEGETLQTEAYDPVTLVRVEASRYNAGGEAVLYFHGESSRFDPIENNKISRGVI